MRSRPRLLSTVDAAPPFDIEKTAFRPSRPRHELISEFAKFFQEAEHFTKDAQGFVTLRMHPSVLRELRRVILED